MRADLTLEAERTVRQGIARGRLRNALVARVVPAIWTLEGNGVALVTFLCFFPRFSHLAEYLFVVLVLVGVGALWLEGKTLFAPTPLDRPMLLFLGWVLVTVPFAVDPAYSFAEWRKLVTRVLSFYWTFRVLEMQPDGTVRLRVLTAVQIGSALLGLYAAAEFILRSGSLLDRDVRAGAPSSDYNWLSTYMVIAIPLLLMMSLAVRAWWQRIASAAVVGLAFLAEMLSYTRAGWLGLAAEGLAFGWLTGRRRFATWVLGSCILVAVVLSAVSQLGYQRSTTDLRTFKTRLAAWKLQLGEVLAHPLVGVGYGGNTFTMRFPDHPDVGDANGPHSTVMMVAMGSGVPALVFLVWIFAAAVRHLARSARDTSDRSVSALQLAVAVMLIGFATRNLFDYMLIGSLAYLVWILLAVGLEAGQRGRWEAVHSRIEDAIVCTSH